MTVFFPCAPASYRMPPAKSIADLAADPSTRAFWSDGSHGLPIDLVEPCPARVEGDRVPCHLFMPEVAWSAPVGPVIRVRPRRDHWLQPPVVRWPPVDGDMPEPPGVGLALSAITTYSLFVIAVIVLNAAGVLR